MVQEREGANPTEAEGIKIKAVAIEAVLDLAEVEVRAEEKEGEVRNAFNRKRKINSHSNG